jgi:uncharacterized membrane protein YbhN (UPF0104 family)
VPATARAYYVGQLGKYVPGKALALIMRGAMVQGPGVRLGVALVTSFYEVLTTMAAGALLAAVLFLWQPPAALDLEWDPAWLGLLLLVVVGVPLLPGVFNRLVRRASARFRQVESLQMPPLRAGTLLLGLAVTGAGWLLLGVSLWAMLYAVLPEPPALTAELWGRCTAVIGLAYVAGFLMVFMPGGLGAREFFLSALLVPELSSQPAEEAAAVVALVVVLLRLTWTLAELIVAAVVWWLPRENAECRMRNAE